MIGLLIPFIDDIPFLLGSLATGIVLVKTHRVWGGWRRR